MSASHGDHPMIEHLILLTGATTIAFGLYLVVDQVLSKSENPALGYRWFFYSLVFGVMEVICIGFGYQVKPGVVIDARGAVIALSVINGGYRVGFSTMIIALLTRLTVGGAGMQAGLYGILLDSALSFLLVWLWKKRKDTRRGQIVFLVICGLTVGCSEALSLRWIGSAAEGYTYFHEAGMDLFLTQVLCTLLMGSLIHIQKERQRSREVYRTALSTSMDGFILVGKNGDLLEVNQALETMTGYTRAELIGMNISKLKTAKPHGGIPAWIQTLHPQAHGRFETQWHCKDGKTIDLEVTCSPAPESHGSIYAFLHDITQVKQDRVSLQKSEARFRRLVEGSPDIIYTYSMKKGGLFYSSRTESILGYPVDYLYTHPFFWFDSIHPDDQPKVRDALNRLSKDQSFEIDYRIRTRQGAWRWFRDRSSTRNIEENEMVIDGQASDITDLKEKQEELTRVYNLVPDMICELDHNGHFNKLNQAWERVLGYTEAEMHGRHFTDFVHPDDWEATQNIFSPTSGGQLMNEFVNRYRHKNGSYVWLEWSAYFSRDLDLFFGSARDITEHKLDQIALDSTKSRLHHLLSSSPVVIFSCKPSDDFKITFISENVRAMTGYEPQQFLDNSAFQGEHIHPEDSPQTIVEFTNVLTRGKNHREYRFLTKNGTYRWTSDVVNVFRDKNGDPIEIIGSWFDITERKRAEQDLEASERRYRLLAENSSDIIWLYNLGTDRFDYISPSVERVRGYTVEESIHQHLWDTLPEDLRPNLKDRLLKRIADLEGGDKSVRTRITEMPHKCQDGTLISTEVVTTLVTNASGKVTHIQGVSRDITQRKKTDERLRKLNRALEARSECAQAMIRASQEDEFLRQICRILVELAGYRMAWIGSPEEDEAKTVRVLAHAGTDDGFLDSAQITWADKELGRGPTGTCIRNHAPCSVRNIATTPEVEVWRELAAQRQYKAAAAFPLIFNEHLIGSLTVYSSNPETFDESEMALLTELANDIAFGLSAIRTRAARARAEQELMALNQQLEHRVLERTGEALDLYNNAPCGYHSLGPNGIILQVNDTELKWFGYRRDEVEGSLRMPAFLAPEESRRFEEYFEAFILSGDIRTCEFEAQRKDGTTFSVLITASAIRDPNGRFLRTRSTMVDITERKEAENRLRTSEARFRQVIEMAPLPIGLINEKEENVYFNTRFIQTFGYTLEDLPTLNEWWEKAYPDADYRLRTQVQWNAAVEKAAQTHTDVEPQEYQVTCKNGSKLFIMISGTSLGNDFLATFLDITKLREANDKLRKLSQAIEYCPSMILITDRAGHIDYVNPAWEQVTGYRLEEVFGQRSNILKSGVHSEEFYSKLWQEITAGRIWRGELCNRKKNGKLYWESCAIAPFRNETGTITHFVAVKEDITERKQAAEELREAKDAADTANRAKSTFLANMSHEIRTPMNAILGFSQLLLRDSSLSGIQHQQVTTITRSGEHLMQIINDILEMSRIESGRITLNPAPFDFHQLLDDLERMFAQRAQTGSLHFHVERLQKIPRFIIGDETKLRQILINLLGNAFKFTPANGSVILRTESESEPDGMVRLRFEVEDTGPGISPEDIPHLFKAFFQTNTGKRLPGGTGLGLTISREFVHLMGGDLTVSSQLGSGTKFRFDVQVGIGIDAGTHAASAQSRQILHLVPGTPLLRILVTDDRAVNRELLRQILEPVGFEIRTANDGAETISICKAWSPHLVLLDLRMPVMDGYEAASEIKKSFGTSIKIIAVSASVFVQDQQRAIEQGADAFLAKPFREFELFDKIKQLIGVDYVYENTKPAPDSENTKAKSDVTFTDAVRRLPPELVKSLREATCRAKYDEMISLSNQVAAIDAPLGNQFLQLVENFDYGTLQHILSAPN